MQITWILTTALGTVTSLVVTKTIKIFFFKQENNGVPVQVKSNGEDIGLYSWGLVLLSACYLPAVSGRSAVQVPWTQSPHL